MNKETIDQFKRAIILMYHLQGKNLNEDMLDELHEIVADFIKETKE